MIDKYKVSIIIVINFYAEKGYIRRSLEWWVGVAIGKLCRHNFEHNRCVEAFESYASIIGINWHNYHNLENLGHTIIIQVAVN